MIPAKTLDMVEFTHTFYKKYELMSGVLGASRSLHCSIKRNYRFAALPKVPEKMELCKLYILHTSFFQHPTSQAECMGRSSKKRFNDEDTDC